MVKFFIMSLTLGVHVSSAGKIYNSVERAENLGCNTMQIFARNPCQWRRGELSDEDIKVFREKVKSAKINPVVLHIPYTLNLSSSKERFYRITIREFILDLIEADKLGADFLVTHMGSYKGTTEEKGLLKIAKALKKILEKTEGVKTLILLENTSGSGHWLGYNFLHIKKVLEKLNYSQRIGICLDTAHCWGAGYKIDNLEGVNDLLDEIKKEAGIERLKLIHLNDTKEKLDSKHDRHFAIGEGNIGKEGFYSILHHPELQNLPFILETPKESDEDDIKNLDMVKKIYYDGVSK